ncbi:MAG: hypothetical protein V1692_02725, partial [bacterium]
SSGFVDIAKQPNMPVGDWLIILVANVITTALSAFMAWGFYTDFKHKFFKRTWEWRTITSVTISLASILVLLNLAIPNTMKAISGFMVDNSLKHIVLYFVKGFEPLSNGKPISSVFLSQIVLIGFLFLGCLFKKTRKHFLWTSGSICAILAILYLIFGFSLAGFSRTWQEKPVSLDGEMNFIVSGNKPSRTLILPPEKNCKTCPTGKVTYQFSDGTSIDDEPGTWFTKKFPQDITFHVISRETLKDKEVIAYFIVTDH